MLYFMYLGEKNSEEKKGHFKGNLEDDWTNLLSIKFKADNEIFITAI